MHVPPQAAAVCGKRAANRQEPPASSLLCGVWLSKRLLWLVIGARVAVNAAVSWSAQKMWLVLCVAEVAIEAMGRKVAN